MDEIPFNFKAWVANSSFRDRTDLTGILFGHEIARRVVALRWRDDCLGVLSSARSVLWCGKGEMQVTINTTL